MKKSDGLTTIQGVEMRVALPCEMGCEFDELCSTCGNGNYVLTRDRLPAYHEGDICPVCGGSGIAMQTAVDDDYGVPHVQVNGKWTPVDSLDNPFEGRRLP